MSLVWRLRLAYAVGHVLNDLCSSVWFTYALVFFKFGVNIPTSLAGTIILIGQIADGLATPLVGFFSDRSYSGIGQPVHINAVYEELAVPRLPESARRCPSAHCLSWCPRGRKAWHFGGSLLVIFSFPLLFGSPVGAMNSSVWAKMCYYLPVVILFQIGWASAQITHLAMMNDLTIDPGERTLLTSLRYLFTVLSNLAVYLCTFFLLGPSKNNMDTPKNFTAPLITSLSTVFRFRTAFVLSGHPTFTTVNRNSTSSCSDIDFGPGDLPTFRNLSLAIIGVGGFMTLLFHLGVRHSDSESGAYATNIEIYTESSALIDDAQRQNRYAVPGQLRITVWRDWLTVPLFWIQGFLYMTVRLIVNVSQTYISVYLLHSLLLPKNNMALVPLTIYLCSIASLLVQKPIQSKISRELNTILGFIFITVFCIVVNHPGNPVLLYRVYIAAGMLGIGCTIILVTSLTMVSDLIGTNQENGAFVYGYMSFTDKLANGIVIQLIELFCNRFSCSQYYQHVESYGIGGWVVAGLVFLIIQVFVKRRTYGPISLFSAWRPGD